MTTMLPAIPNTYQGSFDVGGLLKTLKELGFTKEIWPDYWAVKESVFPFNRFLGQDGFHDYGRCFD